MKAKILIGKVEGRDLYLPLSALKKHFISIGSTGSGKTVLSKVLVEEAAMQGIPSILIDPHGDLASLAMPMERRKIGEKDLDMMQAEKLRKVPVNIFTPESKAGIPISVSPLEMSGWPSREERVNIADQIASAMTTLLGYDLASDKGGSTKGILYTVLMEKQFSSFQEIIGYIEDPNIQRKLKPLLSAESQLKEIARKLTLLTLGKSAMLFESGFRLDLNEILSKPAINVIYLNTLNSQEEKDFFVSILVKDIYEWMMRHPSKELQLLFLIDEVAPFIPAGALKPASKDILKMLFKQARKYGVGCLVATQNPGDIDYMAFSQFGSWAIGRLTTRQDQKKVEEALESVSSEDISEILPSLLPGNFMLFSPDNFPSVVRFKARWLYTEHIPLTENDVARLMEGRRGRRHPGKSEPASSKGKAVMGGREIFPLKISDPGEIIKKHLKRSILGKPEEQILSQRLELVPVYRLSLKKDLRVLGFKVGSAPGAAVVSAADGSLIQKDLDEIDLSLLYKLNEDQLMAYALVAGHRKIATSEVAYRLKIPAAKAKRLLASLESERAVSYHKEGGRERWYLVKEVPRASLRRYGIPELETEQYDGAADIQKARISEEDAGRVMKVWFSSDVTDSSTFYMPVYKVVLQSRKGERAIRINGTTGRVLA